jgi:alanyl-tRNA synthetase
MTEKLYYTDANCYRFQARILERVKNSGKLGLVLDRTYFYPEGGGQPSDQGEIEGVKVYDVQIKDEKILHYIDHDVKTTNIQASIDKDRRADYMQQHTGQHILSQSLLRVGKINTVSVHFGEQETYIETDANSISDQTLNDVQKMANWVIQENVEVKTSWVDSSEVSKYHIRRPPPDVSQVRIVQIGDFDATACGGLHVSSTGQVGLCKIIGSEKIRGRTRIHTKLGDRAFRDYQDKTLLLKALGLYLTCGEDAILKRIEDLNTDYGNIKRELTWYQTEWVSLLVNNILKSAPIINEIVYAQYVFNNVDNKVLKIFIEQVLSGPQRIAVVINKLDNQLTWMMGQSLKTRINLRELVNELLTIIDAIGGGNEELIQGGGKNTKGIEEFLEKLRLKLERKIKDYE